MEQFVCVRVIMANAMDLSLFQFDYDMSFAVTFLHADRTVYSRYGSRQDKPEEADNHISMEGLAETMETVLSLHQAYPDNRAQLEGKQPRPVTKQVPEDYPELGKYKDHLDYGGAVAKSCVHCHQLHEAQRLAPWTAGEKITDAVLHPWPMPNTIGLTLDPKTMATVAKVTSRSPAEAAGFESGDVLQLLDNQRVTSVADIQWILHHAPGEAALPYEVMRNGNTVPGVLRLAKNWRQQVDIAWRTSTWDLRRIALGGAVLVPIEPAARQALNLKKDALALRVSHAGRYGSHAVAWNAGIRPGDVYVAFDSLTTDQSETDIIRHVLTQRKIGDRVMIAFLRDGQRREVRMKIQ